MDSTSSKPASLKHSAIEKVSYTSGRCLSGVGLLLRLWLTGVLGGSPGGVLQKTGASVMNKVSYSPSQIVTVWLQSISMIILTPM